MSNLKPEDEPSTSQMENRRKIDEPPNQLAIAAVPNEGNEETRPQIFKLDVDCVQELFDWLSIRDIHSVAETCTRMQRIAGDYLQPNLQALQLRYEKGEFKKVCYDKKNLNGLKEFVQKLSIISGNDEDFRSIGLHCKSLKQLNVKSSQLNATKIEYINPILSKIESVKMFDYLNIDGNFCESFLQFCPRLKHFCVYSNIDGTSSNWLLQSYPTLEHLELNLGPQEIPELGVFFERNPHLQKLTFAEDGFTQNINVMIQAGIKLQVLVVTHIIPIDETFCGHLKQLHDQGFYQRLHLDVVYTKQRKIEMISSLNGLEKLQLRLNDDSPSLNLSSFTNLKELGLTYFCRLSRIDFESIAKRLVNLERLLLSGIDFEMIELFTQYSAKLKVIKIDKLLRVKNINLLEWNKKREKLVGARKVKIYLGEDAFMATKWNNKTTDLKMIELKRVESYDWQPPGGFY